VKQTSRPISVVVAGGGTAGHIEPALAVADALRELDPTVTVTALGSSRGLETTLVPARGYALELIPPVPLPRKPTLDLVKLPVRVARSVRRTREIFAAVAGSGISAPGSQDAEVIGIPVRPTITGLDRAAMRAQARAHFGLPEHGPVLLVFGGSQGARSLNDAVSGASAALAAAGISVLHAHGPKNTLDVEQSNPDAPYVAVPYIDRMDLAYAAADLAICRSGAMTVAEVSATGLPAVYVPLPHGNGEQELNARPVADAGGGILVADATLSAQYVTDTVVALVADTERIAAMSRAAAGAGHKGAAAAVAQIVLDTAHAARR
jgi:UDP-N-acetylglucosamine--N-acetylmuramyl-(pentapeptide) pyrophosphoryl-undecaprenol N-acetylglucosamine transferase